MNACPFAQPRIALTRAAGAQPPLIVRLCG